jgi:O-antigen biosynthesis protein
VRRIKRWVWRAGKRAFREGSRSYRFAIASIEGYRAARLRWVEGVAPRNETVQRALQTRSWHSRWAIRTVPQSSAVRRITVVTDSLSADNIFGGVATAVILATLWANRTGRELRFVTRHAPNSFGGLEALARVTGIRPERDASLEYVGREHGHHLPVAEGDTFLTTSWWNTAELLPVVPAKRISYIVQEDERQFYPVGDYSLRAADAMNHPDLTIAVNTQQLLDYLVDDGLVNMASTAVAFEPSVTYFRTQDRVLTSSGRKKLFFYARPHHPRNLFDLGMEALDRAVSTGILPSSEWEIHLLGNHLPRLTFSDGSRPTAHAPLGWPEYRDFLSQVDLGLSLMASPHPSYPPLDLAVSGSVVVTNQWRGKRDLSAVSERLLMVPPTVEDVVEGLAAGAGIVSAAGSTPFSAPDSIVTRSWAENLEHVIDHLERRLGRD